MIPAGARAYGLDSDESLKGDAWESVSVEAAEAADTMESSSGMTLRQVRGSMRPEDDGVVGWSK